MKYLSSFLFLSLLMTACSKPARTDCKADMSITKATVSNAPAGATGIQFVLEAYAPNLCYSFSNLSVQQTAAKTYEIRAVASISCDAQVCAQALYQTTRSGTIDNLSPGTYTLHFCTNDAIFTTITVTI